VVTWLLRSAAVLLVLAGCGIGALDLTYVEVTPTRGSACGPAVFGRWSSLPTPECGDAFTPLVVLTWLLVGMGLSVAAVTVLLALRARRRPLGAAARG